MLLNVIEKIIIIINDFRIAQKHQDRGHVYTQSYFFFSSSSPVAKHEFFPSSINNERERERERNMDI